MTNISNKRAKSYWRRKYALTLSGLALSFILLAALQLSGLSTVFKDIAFNLCANIYLQLAAYLFLFSLAVSAVILPLNFYESFILEHRFNLSNQSISDWVRDEMKSGFISFILFLILIEAFYAIAMKFPGIWWIVAAVFWIFISVVLAKVFPIIVIPLFFKYRKLSDGMLRDRALKLAERFNMKVTDVFEIDFSKKTKKANAAIVGWGSGRRIILADNLIREFSQEEVEVVLAHELAHQKLKHMWKLLYLSAATILFLFFILGKVLPGLSVMLHAQGPFDIAIFPSIYLIFIVYELLMMPVQNGISRKLENDADIMALKATGLKEPFISLMNKLAEKNLSDKEPNFIIEILFYSHPSIAKRIKLAENISL